MGETLQPAGETWPHKCGDIWQERCAGCIHDWNAADCHVHTPPGVSHTADEVDHQTQARMQEFPDRQIFGEDVIIGDKGYRWWTGTHEFVPVETSTADFQQPLSPRPNAQKVAVPHPIIKFDSLTRNRFRYSMSDITGIDSGRFRKNHNSIFKSSVLTMPVTINDISEKLGVSISTVSRALNNRADVSKETRKRVLQVAQELGYQPSEIARSLRRQRTQKIGFVFNDAIIYFSDYFAEVIAGATIAAEGNGHNIVLYTNEGHSPDGLLQLCRSREVDGLILVWDHVPSVIIDPLLAEGLPFVILGRRVNHPLASYIAPDNYGGARALMQHFLDLGHTRIGFTTRRLSMKLTRVDRFAAYEDALENVGIPFDPTLVVETEGGLPDNDLAAKQLLDLPNPPTAIFAFHDLVAVDILNTIRERGLRVPQDVALAGFDGLNASLFTKPSITTVKQPLREIGSKTVQALLQCIDNPNQAPIQITLPVKLEIRESTIG